MKLTHAKHLQQLFVYVALCLRYYQYWVDISSIVGRFKVSLCMYIHTSQLPVIFVKQIICIDTELHIAAEVGC